MYKGHITGQHFQTSQNNSDNIFLHETPKKFLQPNYELKFLWPGNILQSVVYIIKIYKKYSFLHRGSRMLQLHHHPLCNKMYISQNNSVEGAGLCNPTHALYRQNIVCVLNTKCNLVQINISLILNTPEPNTWYIQDQRNNYSAIL